MTERRGMERREDATVEEVVFPLGFRWGVATSSHQCEGGTTNNWSRWEEMGHTAGGQRSGLACDWWAHAERDFDLAQELGLNALRLSLEWSRIEPRPGAWDNAALARYRQMLQGLRARGLEPLVTLHHFTHPLWFEDRGAFLAPDAVERFARYAVRVVEALGDLCDFWCTINEPNVYATFAYQLGGFPPGRTGDFRRAMRAQAGMARAHAAAYYAIHGAQPNARVGWAHHYNTFDPANEHSWLDHLAAGVRDAAFNDVFPRAVRTGRALVPLRPLVGDLSAVRGTCDYVGINTYYRDLVAFDPRRPRELFGRSCVVPTAPRGDSGAASSVGAIYPHGIARAAQRAAALGRPLYITEHGVADHADRLRPWLLATAARTMHEALQHGIDLRGYYHWTLVDNYEWADGWSLRFGLIALDERTQARHPRPSAGFYREIARANALTSEMVARYAAGALAQTFPLE
ncbi:MAG: glycoside hydrolase family 1 protein [Ktedonobacterales bacterium]|nr:glycoside hydrolase family 1 protein [Ktedonobacterales bacterium]